MRERHPVIRQVYVISAVVAFCASFAPLWVPSADDGDPGSIGTINLWSAAGEDEGGAAAFGVLLIVGLAVIAIVAASTAEHGRGLPIMVVAMGIIALSLLVAKPQAGDPSPAYGPGAGLLLGASILLTLTALIDFFSGGVEAD